MNKLLIIEDDVTIRNALRILLENQGYFIEEAHDGEEGLKNFDSTFDLLIIDIMMPNISGIDVCDNQMFDDIAVIITPATEIFILDDFIVAVTAV